MFGDMEWYDRAKRIMRDKDIPRDRVQEHLGVEESTLRSYLNGTRTPTIYKLASIADLLEISLDELMGRAKYAPAPLPGAVNEPEAHYRRYRILRENFDALTEKQQEQYLRELQEAKQRNEELLSELLKRPRAGNEH